MGPVNSPDSGLFIFHQETRMKPIALKLSGLLLTLACTHLHAQNVEVKDAWVRTSVKGQMATGAFMRITAKESVKLVGASSPMAGVVEVHEMKMEGNVMKMNAVPALDLPAGKTVELKPGSYHVMLMDLKSTLTKDSTISLTLNFKDAKGASSKLELKVPVLTAAPAAAAHAEHGQDHKH
jgi:copper(I)-binding protein